MTTTTTTATVEVLTAEVRVLMVGSRQVTMSVYKQLDWVEPWELDPMGRVEPDSDGQVVSILGRDIVDGCLVRALVRPGYRRPVTHYGGYSTPEPDPPVVADAFDQIFREARNLPLIILAGLR